MKRFEFSLDTVLRLRVSEEKEWENRLAAITGEIARIQLKIGHFTAEKKRCAMYNQFRDINTLLAVSNYQARMDKDIKSARQMLRVKEKERESVLKDFIEASKKRKILDKLKEKKLEEYHHLKLKDEAKKVDDINNSKWAGKAQ